MFKDIARRRTIRVLRLLSKKRCYSKRWIWSRTCRIETCQFILHSMGNSWMRVDLWERSWTAGVKRWLVVAEFIIIRILVFGSNVGRRCAKSVRAQSVQLSCLTCRPFVVLMRMRTHVVCTLCFGSLAELTKEKKLDWSSCCCFEQP